MAGELVWDDDIQRYKGVPEFMPTSSFDVDAWLAARGPLLRYLR